MTSSLEPASGPSLLQRGGRRPRRVLVVGFDGATFDLIRPWAAAGLLPTFRRLMERGAWGALQSSAPPVTPTAWSSLVTGLNPGKHGVFDFFAPAPGGYETHVVNATHRHGLPLWSLLSRAGQRVTVFNVPATYPPEQVNGLMVSGLLTPAEATDAAWPPHLLSDLKEAVPGFGFYPPGVFSKGQEAQFVEEVLHWDQMTLCATEHLMNRHPWDFLFTVFSGIDLVSHFMWRPMVGNGASQPAGDPHQEDLADAIQSVYRQADAILGTLLAAAGDDSYVLVVSDHGFGPLEFYLHLNAWLAQKGYLRFRRTPQVQLRVWAYRLGLTPLAVLDLARRLRLGGRVQNAASRHHGRLEAMVKRTFLSLADVDWGRTTAYSAGYGGPIFLNLKGRQPQGIVNPGAESEALLRRLECDLRALSHPVTGEPFVGEIYRPADLYWGPYADRAPDLMFAPRDWSNQGYGVHDFASNRWLEPSPDRSGTHRMNGILLLHGPGVLPGCCLEGSTLLDVAPTVLALMGVPVPKNIDGRVLLAALDEGLRSELSVVPGEDEHDGRPQAASSVWSELEETQIRERLAALGYWG